MVYGLIFQRKESDGQEYICQGRMILEIYVVTAVGRKNEKDQKEEVFPLGFIQGGDSRDQAKWSGEV